MPLLTPQEMATMITRLEGPLRREISIDGHPYVVTLTPSGMLLTEKGRRKGFEMEWSAFVSGEVALASALNASLTAAHRPRSAARANAEARVGNSGSERSGKARGRLPRAG